MPKEIEQASTPGLREPLLIDRKLTDIAPVLTLDRAAITDDASQEEIRRAAFDLYMERGCQDGHDVDDWLEAEVRIHSRSRPRA